MSMNRYRLSGLFPGILVLAGIALFVLAGWQWAFGIHHLSHVDQNALSKMATTVFRADPHYFLIHEEKEPKSFTVSIRNPYSETVEFSGFQCDCSCTSANLKDTQLAPGQETVARISVSQTGLAGVRSFSCHWLDGSGRRWSATVPITTHAPFRFSNERIDIGTVELGNKFTQNVHYEEVVRNIDELCKTPEFEINAQAPDSVSISTHVSDVESLPGGFLRRQSTLSVTVSPQRFGRAEVTIQPKSTMMTRRSNMMNSINIWASYVPTSRLVWDVPSKYEITPPRIAITTSKDETVKRRVRIRTLDGSPVAITAVTSTDRRVSSVILKTETPNQIELEITFPLDELDCAFFGEIVLTTSPFPFLEIRLPVSVIRLTKLSTDRP